MSQFLPEGQKQSGLPEIPKDVISDSDMSLMRRVLSRPEVIAQVAPNFLAYIVDYLAVNQPLVPISQISGFSQFTAQYATVGTEQSITSSSYGDLATVGPSLSNLPSGQYVFIFGAALEGRPSDNSTISWMSLSFNGAAASDNDGIRQQGALAIPAARATVKTLTSASNTVAAKYRWSSTSSPVSNPTAAYRWLVALKYANA